jgi:hypothetical protein
MVWAKRTLWLLLTLFAGVLILQGVASESGEVVVLSTQGSGDKPEETRLWVVDLDGFQYLRAGQRESAWLKRLQAAPRVAVERGDDRMAYDAVPEPERRDEINALMATKYGWADAFIGKLFGRADATPVRLVPVLDTTPPVRTPAPVDIQTESPTEQVAPAEPQASGM